MSIYQPTSSGSTNGPIRRRDDFQPKYGMRMASSTMSVCIIHVHDRSRTTSSSTPLEPLIKQSSRHQHSQQSHRHSIRPSATYGIYKTSPQNARETFLNYFLWANGPGPIAGSSMERPHGQTYQSDGICRGANFYV